LISKELKIEMSILFTQQMSSTSSGRQSSRSISWDIRINVALGAARGLAFLHDDQTQVIYRDLKTANVLLDDVRRVFFNFSA
jgi:serine/threonine protein kinase